jgi:hypothetical protein
MKEEGFSIDQISRITDLSLDMLKDNGVV